MAEEQKLGRKGHRERVRASIVKNGTTNMPEYQMVEYILFHGIPYKDTKPIAYELINKFGDISGICNASIEELLKTNGMTYNMALFLKVMPEIAERIGKEKGDNGVKLITVENTIAFLTKIVDTLREVCYVLSIDKDDSVIGVYKIMSGSGDSLNIPTRMIVKPILENNAHRVIIVHNHPSGAASPSKADLENTLALQVMLNAINVEIKDHMIIFGTKAYSILNKQMYKFQFTQKERK